MINLNSFNSFSAPSELKITDMRITSLKDAPMPSTLIRLDTNQGICGYGELRDFASPVYALMLKRLIIGENPCNVEKIFKKIKQFGGHGRQGGGVSAIETAVFDLAGKAYNVPVFQMLGGKYRDEIRIYRDCHIHGENTGKKMGAAMKAAIGEGYELLKMNLKPEIFGGGISTLAENSKAQIPGGISCTSYTEDALDKIEQYVSEVRDAIGDDFPLSIDHIGYFNVETCIKLAKRLEKYNLTWLEDPQPWQYTQNYKRISACSATPLATGEDIYLADSFKPLLKSGALSVVHPDLLTIGGIAETKRLGDLAEGYGVGMAIHMAGTVVGTMAALHAAAATQNFIAIEFHGEDVTWWSDLTEVKMKDKGHFVVPTSAGLGIDNINDDVLKKHIDPELPGLWISTEDWDKWKSKDRLWS